MLRRTLQWAGGVLALTGVIFVGLRLHSYLLNIDVSRIAPLDWGGVAALSVIYGGANLPLALAWWNLLRHLGASATRLTAIRIYGISQLAKYVPGNIFHLAGRQALGMAADLSAGVLAKATIWELGSVAVAGSLSGWLILPRLFPSFPGIASEVLFPISAALIAIFLCWILGVRPALAFIWQLFFLAISGAVFVALLELVAGGGNGLVSQHWLTIGCAYIAAWLIGLVTPGAPAGVGVREMILLLLLKGVVGETDLLMAVLLGRLVTIVGDLLFFVAASSIPVRPDKVKSNHA